MSNARLALAASLAGAVLLLAVPARAACFEDVGCTDDHVMSRPVLRTLSCENLWMVRNTIYDDNGYCFNTPRAREVFSNDGCSIRNQSRVSLNSFERSNVGRIVGVEREKGCR